MFNLPLDGIVLPDSITDLELARHDHSLEGVHLPNSLTQLSGYDLTLSMTNVAWPSGLTSTGEWCGWKDAIANNALPDSLTELRIRAEKMTHSLQRFPRSLTSLDLRSSWGNHSFDDPEAFPDSLTELYLSEQFDQDLTTKVHLPSKLCSLILGADFNQPIDQVEFPQTLTRLHFGRGFDHPMSSVSLPRSLTELEFGDEFNSSIVDMKLPEGLRYLQFGEKFNQSVDQLILPSTLIQLDFCGLFNRSIDDMILPESLTQLSFDYPNGRGYERSDESQFDQSLVKVKLPLALTSLTLGRSYKQSLVDVVFPSALTQFVLGRSGCFNQPLNGVNFPPQLRVLTLGNLFNQSLVGVDLPSSLTHLELGGAYNQSLTDVQFPSSLTSFTFRPELYTHALIDWQLPPSCRELELRIQPPFSEVHIPDHIEVLHLEIVDNARQEKNVQKAAGKEANSRSVDADADTNRNIDTVALDSVAAVDDDISVVTNMRGLCFPSSLRDLTFTGHLRVSLEGAQWSDDTADDGPAHASSNGPPASLRIEFEYFNLPLLAYHLPKSCTNLDLGYTWNLSSDQLVLPSTLKRLDTGHAFNQYIDNWILPSTLEVLVLGRDVCPLTLSSVQVRLDEDDAERKE